ncbi:hypothetical protein GOODEAATRI_025867 [Goodea atripinnis]|uniref:Uncharacterized protein n=1 Tax=Goodea atripinnis TaxID=208336 RepID=A0ABV0P7V0_9TELE
MTPQVCDYRSSFFSDLEAHFRSVTIRASLTGKGPITPLGSNRSAVTVTPEPTGFPNFKIKPPVNLTKSKAKDPKAGNGKSTQNKMQQNKKQERRLSKHNLALKNLRFVSDLSHGSLNGHTVSV